jgi:hypothetical protein
MRAQIHKKPRDSPGYRVITALESPINREAIQGHSLTALPTWTTSNTTNLMSHRKRKRDQEQVKRQAQEQTVITVDSQDEEEQGTAKRANELRTAQVEKLQHNFCISRSPAAKIFSSHCRPRCTRFGRRRDRTTIIKEI